jgi:hypothetical protein
MRIPALVLTLAVAGTGCWKLTGCCERWENVDKLSAELQCGMTERTVRNVAAMYPGTIVYRPDRSNLPDLVLKHDDTRINCWFHADRLIAIQIAWISEPAKITEEQRISLCRESP